MLAFIARNRNTIVKDESAPISTEDIAKEVERVARAYRATQRSQSRFRIRPYLEAVYRLYRRWEAKSEVKRCVRTAASLVDFRIRHGAHPLKTLIDLTTTEPDPKQRSRWAAALRFAATRNVHPDLLLDFLRRSGGVAALARQGAASGKWD
jgi:hypothetical protein